jgi:plasmid maintenance system killer protein
MGKMFQCCSDAFTVSANLRVPFTFEGEDAFDVELEDYH